MKHATRIVATYVVVFMQMLDTSIVTLALPRMATGLQIDMYDSVWIMTSFGIGLATAFATVKIITGQFGVNLTFKYAMLMFIAFSVGCGFFNGIYEFLICRYFQGLSSGVLVLLSQSIFIGLFGDEKRAMAFSIWGSAVAVAPIIGPFVGGVVTEIFGWQWLFFINLPIITFAYLALDSYLDKDDEQERPSNVDYTAMVALVIFIVSFQVMIDFGEKYQWFESVYIKLLAWFATVSLILFFYFNNRQTANSSTLDLSVFKHRDFALFTLVGALGHAIVFSSLIYLPTWLQASYGMPIIESGVIVAIGGIATFLLSPLVGKVNSTKHHYLLVITALLLITFSFLMMTAYQTDSSFTQLILPRLLMGVGLAMFYSPINSIAFSKLTQTEIINGNAILLIVRVVITNIFMSLIYQLMRANMHISYQKTAAYNMNLNLPVNPDNSASHYYLAMNQANTEALQQIFSMASVVFALVFICLGYYYLKKYPNTMQLKIKEEI